MLPKSLRLPALEIPRVMKTGKRVVKNGVTLVYRTSSMSRFAYIVSTKVDKRAVVRNRLKRLLSESIQHAAPQGIDCVMLGSKQLVGKTQEEIESIVREALDETART